MKDLHFKPWCNERICSAPPSDLKKRVRLRDCPLDVRSRRALSRVKNIGLTKDIIFLIGKTQIKQRQTKQEALPYHHTIMLCSNNTQKSEAHTITTTSTHMEQKLNYFKIWYLIWFSYLCGYTCLCAVWMFFLKIWYYYRSKLIPCATNHLCIKVRAQNKPNISHKMNE